MTDGYKSTDGLLRPSLVLLDDLCQTRTEVGPTWGLERDAVNHVTYDGSFIN